MRVCPSQDNWKPLYRPGYFGRRRDEKIAKLNETYSEGNWELRWRLSPTLDLTFNDACIVCYESSYLHWFRQHPEELDVICAYSEVIDNAITNIESGTDYEHQEAFSTHIQDIAIRNVLALNNRKFTVYDGGKLANVLTIRSSDSNGYKYGPGNIPFFDSSKIEQPSLAPRWAKAGSTEDFWQSNKYVFVRR